MRHLYRPRGPQQPLKRAKRDRPAGNLNNNPQSCGILDLRIPPEPVTLGGLQPVQPVRQRPALLARDPGLFTDRQASPPTQPALNLPT